MAGRVRVWINCVSTGWSEALATLGGTSERGEEDIYVCPYVYVRVRDYLPSPMNRAGAIFHLRRGFSVAADRVCRCLLWFPPIIAAASERYFARVRRA